MHQGTVYKPTVAPLADHFFPSKTVIAYRAAHTFLSILAFDNIYSYIRADRFEGMARSTQTNHTGSHCLSHRKCMECPTTGVSVAVAALDESANASISCVASRVSLASLSSFMDSDGWYDSSSMGAISRNRST